MIEIKIDSVLARVVLMIELTHQGGGRMRLVKGFITGIASLSVLTAIHAKASQADHSLNNNNEANSYDSEVTRSLRSFNPERESDYADHSNEYEFLDIDEIEKNAKAINATITSFRE